MRRTTLPLALLLLTTPARADGPQVNDPSGDALLAAYDLTAVHLSADAEAQRIALTFADADPAAGGRFVVTMATPACDAVTLAWDTASSSAYLSGCLPRQRGWHAAPAWSGDTLTFAVPRSAMPPWWAPGTRVGDVTVTAGPYQDVVVGALYPAADTASGDAAYVLGT